MKTLSKASMLLTCLCMALSPTFGQLTVPNGGFETWTAVGQNEEEPTNWNGNKTGGGLANLGPQTCYRESNNPHTGMYCMKLENGSFFGTPINATGTTGRIEAPNSNPANGYIHTITADPDFSSTFTGKPDSLVGWFRFTQGGSDIGRIQAILHDSFDVSNPDQGGSAAHIIGEALYDVPNGNTANWTRFAVPFTYSQSCVEPRYILLIATASNSPGSASSSTILWVDDLDLVYCSDKSDTITTTVCNSYMSPSGNYMWSQSGTYMDTVACASGNCDSIYTINLTVNAADTSVMDNGSSLTAMATAATFQWVDCDNGNAPIAGETAATFSPVVSGNYAVEVTDANCTTMSTCYNITLSNLESIDFAQQLNLYPNPNDGRFTLNLGDNHNDVEVVITDVNGRVVYNNIYTQGDKMQFNLDQPAGIYFVAVTSEDKHAVVKLVKQ